MFPRGMDPRGPSTAKPVVSRRRSRRASRRFDAAHVAGTVVRDRIGLLAIGRRRAARDAAGTRRARSVGAEREMSAATDVRPGTGSDGRARFGGVHRVTTDEIAARGLGRRRGTIVGRGVAGWDLVSRLAIHDAGGADLTRHRPVLLQTDLAHTARLERQWLVRGRAYPDTRPTDPGVFRRGRALINDAVLRRRSGASRPVSGVVR